MAAALNVFNFNHIDISFSKGTIEMLKNLYAYYHRKHYSYEKLYRGFQRKNLLCNIVVGKAIITSAVAGGITLDPVVFASLTGVVKAVASFKKYDKKAKKANFARVEYKKILDAIRFYLRGEPVNEKAFLDKLKMVDHFTSDHCMEIPEKVEKKIQQTFHHD